KKAKGARNLCQRILTPFAFHAPRPLLTRNHVRKLEAVPQARERGRGSFPGPGTAHTLARRSACAVTREAPSHKGLSNIGMSIVTRKTLALPICRQNNRQCRDNGWC